MKIYIIFIVPNTDFCLEKVYSMNASKDEFDRRGGGSPLRVDSKSGALPEVQTYSMAKDLQRGVSTNYEYNLNTQKDTNPHWYALRCAYGREKKHMNISFRKELKHSTLLSPE